MRRWSGRSHGPGSLAAHCRRGSDIRRRHRRAGSASGHGRRVPYPRTPQDRCGRSRITSQSQRRRVREPDSRVRYRPRKLRPCYLSLTSLLYDFGRVGHRKAARSPRGKPGRRGKEPLPGPFGSHRLSIRHCPSRIVRIRRFANLTSACHGAPMSFALRPLQFAIDAERAHGPTVRAVIYRMGFNNGGLAAALPRARGAKRRGVLGINVGANKDAKDRIADYEAGVAAAAAVADYVTINISSPNTPGLRDLQHGAALVELLARVTATRGATPLILKVAPDQEPAQIDEVAKAAIDAGIDALIVGNTTVSRPPLTSGNANKTGGLSGAPLAPLAAQRLRDFRSATGGKLPLIAVGGIDSGAEAYARIRAGASLVQLYTGLVYGGPSLPTSILRELAALLERDGFARVENAIGCD